MSYRSSHHGRGLTAVVLGFALITVASGALGFMSAGAAWAVAGAFATYAALANRVLNRHQCLRLFWVAYNAPPVPSAYSGAYCR